MLNSAMKHGFACFVLHGLLCFNTGAQTASPRDQALRNAASSAPLLQVSENADGLVYQVLRFSPPGVRFGGQRYGLVRLKVPGEGLRPVVWLFSDVGNIEEYDMLPMSGGGPVRGNMRVIYPPLSSLDIDEETRRRPRNIAFPRPWDFFETHLLGVGPELLKGESEFILWFRFGDARPTDVLMAARVLDAGTAMEPGPLPGWLGLPELGGE
jgi:hypothetical protein